MTTSTTKRRRARGTVGGPDASAATVEAALRQDLRGFEQTVDLLTARLQEAQITGTTEAGVADLERQIIGDPNWRVFAVLTQQEFTAEGLLTVRSVCRLMSIANPLIKRGVSLRTHYVWGQGFEITARANGKNRDNSQEQDVAAVIAAFLDDPANQRSVFGQQACEENERAVATDGEIFIALFTKPRHGWVQARAIVADEIQEVICNPEDASEPWFYRRRWTTETYDDAGTRMPGTKEVLYPDVDYKPRSKPARYAGVQVAWDAPMVHVPVNRPKGWLRGIPDVYAVINWARAYKEFLEQWSRLMASLSKFAWRLTAEGRNRTQARAAVAAAGTSRGANGEVNNVGGTAITAPGATLEAIPKSGATIDAMSGRPLAMMVAAGLDLPVTMLLADPGQTGARATAETLDWPTELAMGARRRLWDSAMMRILRHVITESVRAPSGALKGSIKRDPVTDREIVTLAGDTDDTIDIVWPDLDDVDPKALLDAVVAANATGTPPPDLILRLVLQALGVRDIDSIMERMVDEQGKFLWPETPQNAGMGPGQQAADLARTGGDPATAGQPGSMGPDGEPMPEPPTTGTAGGDVDAVPTTEQGVSPEALARQADAEFGLFGSEPPEPDDGIPDTGDPVLEDDPAAEAGDDNPPARGLYDPARFKL